MERACAERLSAATCMLLLLNHIQVHADILGCGGFVEASLALAQLRKPDDPKLDYSGMQVELRTKDGLLKSQTECAPNGYFFIPMYEKGSFVLKVSGPEGWHFERSSVGVVVDETNQCENGEDIIFQYTGFSLTGRVKGATSRTCNVEDARGPAGVDVHLARAEGGGIDTTTTSDAGGRFAFRNVWPGRYQVTASHPKWSLSNASVVAQLTWGNAEVPDDLAVAGYPLSGGVLSEGKPVADVLVFLSSTTPSRVSCPPVMLELAAARGALCSASTDDRGQFEFGGVPCGEYTLVPVYRRGDAAFEVTPASVAVKIEHAGLAMGVVFQVTGFGVSGLVRDSRGVGVEGAVVTVDGLNVTVTDKEGGYVLTSLSNKRYTIAAAKENARFSTLENFEVQPNAPSLPAMVATHYTLCGKVIVSDAKFASQRAVTLTHGPSPARTQSDDQGGFCFTVVPGKYRAAPAVTTSERQQGLIFSPEFVDVTLDGGPLQPLTFAQVKVSVSGEVKCLRRTCGDDVVVSLRPATGTPRSAVLGLGGHPNVFAFQNVIPGQYTVQVHQVAWCWVQDSIEINVQARSVADLYFVQEGHYLQVKSSHVTRALYELKGEHQNEKREIVLPVGLSRHCIHQPGEYSLVPKGCLMFEKKEYVFNTSTPRLVDLKATRAEVAGVIQLDQGVPSDGVAVEVRLLRGTQVEVVPAVQRSPGALFFSFVAGIGERVVVAPASPELLFRPANQTVVPESCETAALTFLGQLGVFVEGEVTPAIADVEVVVNGVAGTDNNPIVVKTGADGKYKVGPFHDTLGAEVTASLPGYVLEPVQDNPHSFVARQLSQITVQVTINGEPVPEVLVSLSGSEVSNRKYRKHAATAGDGVVMFAKLDPGAFYLRASLKEFSFDPPFADVIVQDGRHMVAKFNATRVGYSAFGQIGSLNGAPEKLVAVEATSMDGEHSEATFSEADGSFRLRGLHPNTTYSVKVPQTTAVNAGVESAAPPVLSLTIHHQDVRGLDFVVLRRPNTASASISGTVDVDPVWTSTLSVVLASAQSPQVVQKTTALGFSRFFEFRSVPQGEYVVRLVCALSAHDFTFPKVESLVRMNSSNVHLPPLVFGAAVRSNRGQDLQQTSMLPLFCTLLAIVFAAKFNSIRGCMSKMKVQKAVQHADGHRLSGDLSKSKNATSRSIPSKPTSSKRKK